MRKPLGRLKQAFARLVVGEAAPHASALIPLRGPQVHFIAPTPLVTGADWHRLMEEDPGAVLERARAAAASGDVTAQVVLARMLATGTMGPADPAAAFALAQAAAKSGQREALNLLGRCHERGWGTPADSARAIPLYRAAADLGDPWAQFNLASLLFDGDGAPCDRPAALVYFLRAARGGNPKAMNMLGRYCEEGWHRRRRPVAAAHWYRRSAEGGDFRGAFNHARILFALGAREAALGWLARAVEGGIPDFCRTVAADLEGHPDPDLAALGRRARMRAGS